MSPAGALTLKETLREMYEQPFYRAGDKDYEVWLDRVVAYLLPRVRLSEAPQTDDIEPRRWLAHYICAELSGPCDDTCLRIADRLLAEGVMAARAGPRVPRGLPTVAQLAAWLTEGIEKFRYLTTGAYTDRQALAEWLRARLAEPGADPALQLTTEDRLRGQVFALQDLLRETQHLLAEWQHNATAYEGCPCTIVTPFNKNCSCANRYLSGGCLRCCKYGSEEQRRAAAERLAGNP